MIGVSCRLIMSHHHPALSLPAAQEAIQSSSPRTPAEAAIQRLYRSTVRHLVGAACQGAEYWVQVGAALL